MHIILCYDCGKLKVLIFGVDEDDKLQVEVNGWLICSTYTNFSLDASVPGKIQEVVSQFIIPQGGTYSLWQSWMKYSIEIDIMSECKIVSH